MPNKTNFMLKRRYTQFMTLDDVKNKIYATANKKQLLQVTMSSPFSKQSPKKMSITTIDHPKYRYKISRITNNQDFTNLTNKLSDEVDTDISLYKQIVYYSDDCSVQVLQNKKGQKIIPIKPKKLTPEVMEKNYLIAKETPFLQRLGITTKQGEVSASMFKKYRQINKFVEIVSTTLKQANQKLNIYDFGCGKGYLTFALHHYLTENGVTVHTTGIDLKSDVIRDNTQVVSDLGIHDLQFIEGDIGQTKMVDPDVVIALHACDIATDIALYQAISSGAKYIFSSPCCHKEIRKFIAPRSPINSMTKHGILAERQAEMLTDTLRCLLLESHGYKTDIFEFVSTQHSPKNLMIRAVYTGNRIDNTAKIVALKELYGISKLQYLERLLA